MTELVSYIYSSAAAADFSQNELLELLELSRNKNAGIEVTGMLLHINGSFFQVLEGPTPQVNSLIELIKNDPRHTKMTKIIHEPIAHRSFGAWTMGFAHVTTEELVQIDGLNDFFTGQKVLSDVDPGRARKLLEAFSHGRWRVKLSSVSYKPVLNKPESDKSESNKSESNKPESNKSAHLTARPGFSFAFQPVIDAKSRTVAGYEAQLCGANAEPPEQVVQQVALTDISQFDIEARRVAIGLAHRLGLTGKLFLSMVTQPGGEAINNLSSTLETARRCDFEPAKLMLLLKHEMALAEPQLLANWLTDFRRQGLQICIWDFGSGHAGLALLEHYQPEMISLGSWLIRGIEENGARQAIIRGLMQTCGDLGIDVLAKGVKTLEEFTWLSDEGIDLYQGDLFAKAGFESLPRPLLPLQASVV